MITENDPMLPRKVDLEKNPSGTELKIAQHRELEKHGKYVAIPGDKTQTRIFVRNCEDAEKKYDFNGSSLCCTCNSNSSNSCLFIIIEV